MLQERKYASFKKKKKKKQCEACSFSIYVEKFFFKGKIFKNEEMSEKIILRAFMA